MLGRVKNFVELFIKTVGIIKQLEGMSKILRCRTGIWPSMPRVIGLMVNDGERPVDLFGSNDHGKFVRKGHRAETPAQGGIHLLQFLDRKSVRAADHDLEFLKS